ncbi:hypothetical protein FNCP11_06640 [Fusobacterium nucleatum]|nr:hypothetical protein FNCP11_06640 [Fusobacterium nucleatum]BEP09740.1 hypothetical protein FNSP11_05840 [Fusobacterium nucleatum]
MDEINDIGNVIANTIDNKGEDKRNFFGILRAQRGATDLYNISGDSLNLLNEAYKSNKIGADEYKEGLRNIIEATGNDLGLNVSLVYLDTSTMPKDSERSTGSSYIVDRKNRKVLIPIDVNKIEDIKELLGTLTEEVAHGKDALEGRQDKKVAEDKSNDEEGLETLGRPANEYVKNKLGEDNNSKIKLSTDGIDLTNADVGEKVGDVITPGDREERAKLHKENKEFQKILNRGSEGLQQQYIRGKKEFEKALEYLNDPERREQIENGIINGLIGVGVVAAGIIVTAAAVSSGPGGWVAIGSVLIPAETAAVGGVATVVVGTARADYGSKKIANALTDDELKEPKHLIADTVFKNYKDEYYLGEAMLGAGMLNIAPHTFPIGTVENIPLQQGALPYYSNTYANLPAVTNVGNTSLALYNNQNGLFAPVGTNVIPAMTPLLITDGANKVNQVQNNSLPYNSKLALPVKYPIVTKSGVTLYKGYAMGPRGAKYTEVGVSNNKEIVYKNSNGSYFKLTDKGLENISSKDVIKKEYFPTVKVQKNNGSNPSAGKDYYVSKEGNFKVEKYIEAGQTVEDYDKKYLVENARARGINVGRSKEHTNTTLGHWEKAVDIADEASKDPNVKAVYVDEALRNISDKFKDDKTIPDVTIEYEDGTFKLIEVQSKTDRFYDLQDKLQNLQTKYGKDVIKNYKVEKPKGGK